MTEHVLVAGSVIDHDISLTNGSRSTEVEGVWVQIRVSEQTRAIPRSGVLW